MGFCMLNHTSLSRISCKQHMMQAHRQPMATCTGYYRLLKTFVGVFQNQHAVHFTEAGELQSETRLHMHVKSYLLMRTTAITTAVSLHVYIGHAHDSNVPSSVDTDMPCQTVNNNAYPCPSVLAVTIITIKQAIASFRILIAGAHTTTCTASSLRH